MTMNRRMIGVRAACLAAIMLTSAAPTVHADELELRLRGIYLAPVNASTAYGPLQIPENAIHVNDKWLPDFDVEYFLTPHWSAELVLTYPQKQDVRLEHSALGTPANIGSFKHLPPTLTAKYNFLPGQPFQPYVGAGLNVTSIMDVKLQVPGVGHLTLDHTSVGAAAQTGFDYEITEHWYFNADAKWIMLRSDAKFDGEKISRVRIDPVLLGVGFGYRFGVR